jgi:hypothetical protein
VWQIVAVRGADDDANKNRRTAMSEMCLEAESGAERQFGRVRTRVAVALQCLPLLGLGVIFLDRFTGGGLFAQPDPSAVPVGQVIGLALLLGGAGYVMLGRWRRALCFWMFEACSWIWLESAFALAGRMTGGTEGVALWATCSVAAASVLSSLDLRNLAVRPSTMGGRSSIFKTLLACAIVAALLIYLLPLTISSPSLCGGSCI